jgi:hypothetical protein
MRWMDGPTAAGASVSARAEYPPHTLPRPPPCVTLTTACRMRSSVGVGRLRRDGRGRRGYRRTPCPRAFLMARPHRGRVPDGYPRAAIGSCRPMRACAPDAVGLLPDVRRLSGYYRAAEHCSSTESQHGYDMHANESRYLFLAVKSRSRPGGPARTSAYCATAQYCCLRFAR